MYRVKPEQEYIAYGKGAIAFNTLAYYMGEEKMNGILKTYLSTYENREDIYPTSLDVLKLLKEETDKEDYAYLIHDFFETLTLYENSIDEVSFDNGENGNQKAEIVFSINKYLNDKIVPDSALQDYIEIGLFDARNELLQLEKIKVTQKVNRIRVEANRKINSIVLDPNYLLLDKDRVDNRLE